MSASIVAMITTEPGIEWMLQCAAKAAAVLAASGVAAVLLRRSAAAARHQVWSLGVVGALLMPGLSWLASSLWASPAASGAASAATGPSVNAGGSAAVSLSQQAALPASAPSWPTIVAAVWALGALVVAMRLLRGHFTARQLANNAAPHRMVACNTALQTAARELKLRKRVTLLRSEQVSSPMTIGVVWPRILLPAAADSWSPERLVSVLLHELGHVRRRDTLVQLVAQVGCALYWFNPLAWLATARLHDEREYACDDLVLATGIRPSSYAGDLLEVARGMAGITYRDPAAICMVERAGPTARLQRILDEATPRTPLRVRFQCVALAVTSASTFLLACAGDHPPAPPTTASAPKSGMLTVGVPTIRRPEDVAPPFVAETDPFRPPGVHAEIDLALLATEIQRAAPSLELCYQRQLARNPALAGKVVIHSVIAETGKVLDVCITEDTVGDRAVADCVNNFVMAGHFTPPRGGNVDVSMPFEFKAAAVVAATSAVAP